MMKLFMVLAAVVAAASAKFQTGIATCRKYSKISVQILVY
jgi:hypothetical protein